MTRQLETTRLVGGDAGDRRIASSTGRAIGAALACLMVTSLVVERSIAAVQPADGNSGGAFVAASIALSDDDEGRSLVNLTDMVPGKTTSSCINLTYEGTLFPIELLMTVEALGELSRFVEVTITEGSGGEFGDCTGFVANTELVRGTLADLAETETVVGIIRSEQETKGFRFDYRLTDTSDAIGKSASADIVWEVRPT